MNDVSTDSVTIDGVPVTVGLRVIDYNIDKGVVDGVHHVANDGTVWWSVARDKGGWSTMDGLRLWTRLRTNNGTMVAAEREVFCACGDPTCGCDCVPGNYPCEHGTAGDGC